MLRYISSDINVVFVEALRQFLVTLCKKQKKAIDNGETFGASLGDLSKTFDCLNTFGLSLPTLNIVYDYLSNVK